MGEEFLVLGQGLNGRGQFDTAVDLFREFPPDVPFNDPVRLDRGPWFKGNTSGNLGAIQKVVDCIDVPHTDD